MAKILELWSTGVMKGMVQVSQPPALCLNDSGLFTSLNTLAKDFGSEKPQWPNNCGKKKIKLIGK